MTLAMLQNLDGPSLGVSHGTSYAWELGFFFSGNFSCPLLCLGASMALFWELLIALAMFGNFDGSSLGASHSPCYA